MKNIDWENVLWISILLIGAFFLGSFIIDLYLGVYHFLDNYVWALFAAITAVFGTGMLLIILAQVIIWVGIIIIGILAWLYDIYHIYSQRHF